jgi:hypothetical protein
MHFFKLIRIFFLIILTFNLYSCGSLEKVKSIYKPVDLTKEPLDPDEKIKKNIKEGRGISLGSLGDRKTTYEFSTSNPMWRATLETLDFLPLGTVDYSGGLIVSDWYNNSSNGNEALKITVRFLSNEIQSNSLKIQVHRRECNANANCTTKIIKSSISEELSKLILTRATKIQQDQKKK